MSGKRWTKDETDYVREALAEGATIAEIAEELGCSRQRVQGRCTRLGIGPGRRGCPPDCAKRSRLLNLLREGLTLSAAGRLMGVGANPLRKMAQAMAHQGLLRRTGGATRAARYVPTRRWERDLSDDLSREDC